MKYLFYFLALCLALSGGAFAEESAFSNEENMQIEETMQDTYEGAKQEVNKVLSKLLPEAKVISMEEIKTPDSTYVKCKVSYKGLELAFNIDLKTGAVSKFESNKGNFVTSHPEIATSKVGVKFSEHEVNKILQKNMKGASVEKLKYNKKTGIVSGYSIYEDVKYYFEIDTTHGNISKLEPAD